MSRGDSKADGDDLDNADVGMIRLAACRLLYCRIENCEQAGGRAINAAIRTIERFAAWVILLSGWLRYLVLFLAGAVSALAAPPFDLFFILFLTFPVLVWGMDGVASDPDNGLFHRLRMGFLPGFFFGFGYFLAGLWWIGNAFLVDAQGFMWALPIAIIAVPAVLACFWGAATALARLFWAGDGRRLFILAAFFTLSEYLRSFVATGFPWNPLGGAAYVSPVTMQTASLLGTYAMTAFVVVVFSAFAVFVPGSEHARRRQFAFVTFAFVLLAGHFLFGFQRLAGSQTAMAEGVSLRLMQPNIPQREKFNRAREAEIIKTYLDVSTMAGENGKEGLSGTTHLIWPESSFPFFLTNRRDVLASIAAMLPEGTSLITGAVRGEASSGTGRDYVFNSVYLINDQGEIVSAADKTHLVPFGEYLPFQKWAESIGLRQLTKLEGGFEPGSSRKLLSSGKGPAFLPLVCYEIIFSNELWNGESGRPQWVINVTNDGWFGNTPGPYQHERQAVLRAVEEGLPVVRVSNTGISGVYDPYGRTLGRLGLGIKGVVDSGLPQALQSTFFATHASYLHWVVFACFAVIGIIPLPGRKTGKYGRMD